MILNTLQARLPPENIGTSKGQTLQKPKTNDLGPPSGRRGASTLSPPPKTRKTSHLKMKICPNPPNWPNLQTHEKSMDIFCMRAISAHRAMLSDTSIPAFQLRLCRMSCTPWIFTEREPLTQACRNLLTLVVLVVMEAAASVSGHICRYILVDGNRSEKFENWWPNWIFP